MERELWIELSQAISEVGARWKASARQLHPTARIVRVYLWAAAHDRPMVWACRAKSWSEDCRPTSLPSQPTLSRRTRTADFWNFLEAMGRRLAGRGSAKLLRLRCIDGKPLEVAAHSKDRQATWGRAAGRKGRGYKLHAIWSDSPMPDSWCVAPLNQCEKRMAGRLIRRLNGGRRPRDGGYLLGDGYYDDSTLYDAAADAGQQLVAPRQRPGSGLGHHYQSPHRLHALAMLEVPAIINPFGRELYRQRKQIERDFGNLCGYGGGLSSLLPPWVRRPWRVRNWTHAKLLVNAARIRRLRRRQAAEHE